MFSIGDVIIYIIGWVLLWFIVLPFKVERETSPEPGTDHGAPRNPHLKQKAVVTSLLALVLWGVIRFFFSQDWLKIWLHQYLTN